MKKTFLFLMFALIAIGVSGQKLIDSTDIDQFKNSLGWTMIDNESAYSAIENNVYVIKNKDNNGSYTFFKSFDIDQSANYSYEISIEQISGPTDYGHGIIWGLSDWNNYNLFTISPQGYYAISTTQDKESKVIQEWKKSEAVKAQGYNVLTVQKENKDINFFVNGTLVHTEKVKTFRTLGKNLGIILYKQKHAKVNYVKVKGSFKRINLVPNAIKGFKRENLGLNINSNMQDICPLISPDGKTLYFARKTGDAATGDDVWYSTKNTDGSWAPAKSLSAPINNSGHNNAISVSADNNQLYLSNTYKPDGNIGGEGISISQRTSTGWTLPTKVEIKNFYNTNDYVNNCFSSDNKFLLQAIQRKDSRGSADIYVSFKENDGTYSEPMNLGDVINTSGYETTPFISADNKTLYYSTDGLPGYGSNDIFVTRRLDDTWKNWSEPQNLGPEINSEAWDAYFSIPASGEEAYMVTQNGLAVSDIVKVKLNEQARPKPVVLISGKVLNKKTNLPLSANITYFDLRTNEEAGRAISNPTTGEYNIILQVGKQYGFRAEKELFYAVNDMVDVITLSSYKEIKKDLYLVPIEVGQSIRLNNVFFDFNKWELKPESFSELDRLAEFLKNNPKIEIELGGHTDNVGAEDYNKKLSQQRTESVMSFLVSKGISKERLQAKGYGKSKPIAGNDTEEGKSINRRVEFTIIKQ